MTVSRCLPVVIWPCCVRCAVSVPVWWPQPGESPYHTVHPTESRRHPTLEGLGVSVARQNRSNSWSDVLDESRLAAPEPAEVSERILRQRGIVKEIPLQRDGGIEMGFFLGI